MNLLNQIMSYDKIKNDTQENCNCSECISIETSNSENQITEYPKLSEEEIEKIISERYSYKDEKTKKFIRKALRVHGNKYDYSNVIYVRAREAVEIICNNNHQFSQRPNDHLTNHGCSICAYKIVSEKQKLTLEEFIKRARIVHGNKYDYSKSNYINYDTEIEIICPIHGSFWQTPNNHLRGCDCLICGFIKSAKKQKLTTEEFIEKANEVHGIGRYDYSKVNYVNMLTEVIIICPKHSEFSQRAYDHLRGCGCLLCNEKSKGEIKIASFLTNNNIKFKREKRFKDCRDKNPLPFDFYLQQYNLCIEFDGIQHFNPSSFDFKNKTEIEKNKKI